jgi:hypothetical protein
VNKLLVYLLAFSGSTVTRTVVTTTILVGSLVIYLGVALFAALFTSNREQADLRYRVFHDLVTLLSWRRK